MNFVKALACCAIAAAPMVATAQNTTAPSTYNNPCTAIQWSGKFLAQYPKAPAACQNVEVKDGQKYAMFKGKVTAKGKSSVTVNIENVAGTPGGLIKWHTDLNEPMLINDKEATVGDLKKGDVLTFYVQEGKFVISQKPGGKPLPFQKVAQ